MKLNEEDKALLKEWGHTEKDFRQIEEAIRRSTYKLGSQKISQGKALTLLGRRSFLSGISRSAFHWSAAREVAPGEIVYFNSSRLFDVEKPRKEVLRGDDA